MALEIALQSCCGGVNVGASTSTAGPAVPMDVNDMDSIDDVVSSSQESGYIKITMVTDDTSREPSAGACVSAASGGRSDHRATVRAGGRLISQTAVGSL
jgi:hypothetical protein